MHDSAAVCGWGREGVRTLKSTILEEGVILTGSMEVQERDDKGLQEGNRKGVRDILGEGWSCVAGCLDGSGEGRNEPQFWPRHNKDHQLGLTTHEELSTDD